MLFFGAKSFVPDSGNVILNQTINIVLLAFLGPAALAVYARPAALVKQVSTLVNKAVFVMTPTASALQVIDRLHELGELTIVATRYVAYLAIPLLLALAICSGPILRIWMGPSYALGFVLPVLALGTLVPIVHQSLMSVLFGLNAHGRAGLATLASIACSVALTFVAVGVLDWGLFGAALAIAIPQTIVYAFYLPLRVCRALEVPLRVFLWRIWCGPTLCGAAFGASLLAARLLAARFLAESNPVAGLIGALSAGSLVLGILYWNYVLPPSVRLRLLAWTKVFSVRRATRGRKSDSPR